MKRADLSNRDLWILIVFGCLALILGIFGLIALKALSDTPQFKEAMAKTPVPPMGPITCIMMFAGPLVVIISGIAMLKGQNWGRLLYAIWTPVAVLIGLVTSGISGIILPVVIYLVVVFFLFRPNVNQYFGSSEAEDAVANP